jgi:hypothetical protein
MVVSINVVTRDEIKNKVSVYAKIVSGQSIMFKTPPNGINIPDITKHYTKVVTEQFKTEFKLPTISAKKFAKMKVEELVQDVLHSINK